MRRHSTFAIAVLSTLAFAGTAHAGVLVASAPDCSAATSSQVFAPWLDVAQYVPAPGGSAESTAGWNSLDNGAAIVSGNEPWNVGAASDARALGLPSGASATTDTMCVGIQHPDVRFFSRGSGLGTLRVDALFELADGTVASTTVGVMGPSGWTPTPVMPLAVSLLPLLPGNYTPVRFRFTAVGASFAIDDVYVDPWMSH
jgi:hypothetical protein